MNNSKLKVKRPGLKKLPLQAPRTGQLERTIHKALVDVHGGADIYERPDALLYRSLARLGLVTITEAMNAPKDGAKRQPYFGCVITLQGLSCIQTFRETINGT